MFGIVANCLLIFALLLTAIVNFMACHVADVYAVLLLFPALHSAAWVLLGPDSIAIVASILRIKLDALPCSRNWACCCQAERDGEEQKAEHNKAGSFQIGKAEVVILNVVSQEV